VLGTALGHAVLLGHLQRNVALLVRPVRGSIPPGRSLSLPEARQLLRAAQAGRFEAALTIMLLVGLRPGEALGLRWCDIDLETQTLMVNRARSSVAATACTSDHRKPDRPTAKWPYPCKQSSH
jgi:integrase